MNAVRLLSAVKEDSRLRALNALRDLPAVADLIELCFAPTMDNDGQRYINEMRRAGQDDGFLRWAKYVAETASLPLMGFVWEEDNRIVGNASLVQFRDQGKRVYLIANIATHPDYRHRGIARALTERSIQAAYDKSVSALWLHVRNDNPDAIDLYTALGFKEFTRRTSWAASFSTPQTLSPLALQVTPRHPRFWSQQQRWLRRLYPDSLVWYSQWNVNALRPGPWAWLSNLFADLDVQQWAATRNGTLRAALSAVSNGGRAPTLYPAADATIAGAAEALTQLLIHARRCFINHPALTLDFPANEMTDAIMAAGFTPRRTLIWMQHSLS